MRRRPPRSTRPDTLCPDTALFRSQLRARSLIEQADLENQRKRLERDVRNACRFANKQLLGDLLPVFDSLEAAPASAPDADPLRDGVVLILRELGRAAGNNGLVEIAPGPGLALNHTSEEHPTEPQSPIRKQETLFFSKKT